MTVWNLMCQLWKYERISSGSRFPSIIITEGSCDKAWLYPSQAGEPINKVQKKVYWLATSNRDSRQCSLFACARPISMCIPEGKTTLLVLSRWIQWTCEGRKRVRQSFPVGHNGISTMDTLNENNNDQLDFWRDWDLANLTETEYLNRVLGPKYLAMKMVIPLTIAYVVIFITGIFGNVATCTVIVRNASMQTATNYYLFSLAISDLILLVLGKGTLFLFLHSLSLFLHTCFTYTHYYIILLFIFHIPIVS